MTLLVIWEDRVPIPSLVAQSSPVVMVLLASTEEDLTIDCRATAYDSTIRNRELLVVHHRLRYRGKVVHEFSGRLIEQRHERVIECKGTIFDEQNIFYICQLIWLDIMGQDSILVESSDRRSATVVPEVPAPTTM
jgi:hypothetical protein